MKNRIKYLDGLRFYAILNVILLHVIAIFRWKYFNVNTLNFSFLAFLDSFTRVGIPLFFMITGILMFQKKDEPYKDFLKKRVLKLVDAYLVACIVYYIYHVIVDKTGISIYNFLRLTTSQSIEYHLWFMPVIIMIYLFIPFLKKIAIHCDKKELETLILVVFLLSNVLMGCRTLLDSRGYDLMGHFTVSKLLGYSNYLFLGYYLHKYSPKISKKLIIMSILSILFIPILSVFISTNSINDFFLDSLSPLVFFPSCLVLLFFKEKEPFQKQYTFFHKMNPYIFYVYLIHVLFLSIIHTLFLRRFTEYNLLLDLVYIIILFVVVSVLSFSSVILFEKIRKWLEKHHEIISLIFIQFISYFFILFFSIIIINLILNPYHFIKCNYLDMILGIIFIIGLFYLINKYKDFIFKNKIINIIMIILYIIFQIIIINCFMVKPSWDFGSVYLIARDYVLLKDATLGSAYLYMCDNNIPITLFFVILFKIACFIGLKSYLLGVGITVNLIIIDISLFYIYLLLNRINKNLAKPFFIFCLFFSPLIFYLPIFYTDTITLLFIVIPLYYLYEYFFIKKNFHNIIISGLFLGVGGVLKATVFIPFIAIIIYAILKRQNGYKTFLTWMIFLVLIPVMGNRMITHTFFSQERLKEERIPINHYIMIGLENNGGFSDSLYKLTTNTSGEENRKKIENERIKNRLEELKKNHGFIAFYNRKISYTWTDGTFFSYEKLRRKPYHKKYTKYVLSDKGEDRLYRALSNAKWFILLLLMVVGTVLKKYLRKELRDFQFILNLSIIGLLLFLLIWETRSRYLVNYSPIFLVNAYIGLNAIINYYKEKKIKE
ncbi:MAG: acyltransferase family protein [Bacilli bacterium]|nr:acyltransferase family protein [Bacilli bacterium]